MLDLNQYGNQARTSQACEDPVAAFQDAMTSAGISCREHIHADGQIHRFSTTSKAKDKSGWYSLSVFTDFAAGSFGDWKNGDGSHKWVSTSGLTPGQQGEYRRYQEDLDRAIRDGYENAAHECRQIWESAPFISSDYPYLVSKGVISHGLKAHENYMIVPMVNTMGQVRSLQRIYPDGSKFNWTGGEKQGNYFTIPGDQQRIYICEGYATGATIHKATGGTVIVSFDAGNLYPVTNHIKAKYPTSSITICADNDQWKPGKANTGIEKAKKAGEAFGVKVIWPTFSSTESKPTDFNDLELLEGIDAVKGQIGKPAQKTRIVLSDWTCDLQFTRKAQPRQWLVEDTFPLGTCSILAAMGDSGKGFMLLDLCLSVAEPPKNLVMGLPQAFGHDVSAHGVAVYVTAEDDHEEVLRRLEGLDPDGSRRKAAGKHLVIVPLPNAGGPIPLVVNGKMGPEATIFFDEIRAQLLSIPNVKLVVFDPMASFIMADINEDPACGAYTTGLMSSLGHDLGASVQFSHHMKKADTSKGITPEKAREMVRGTAAIVDGVRSVYALWPAEYMYAQRVCRKMNVLYQRNKVFNGAVIKSNGPADREIKTYLRNDSGLLVACDDTIRQVSIDQRELDMLLVDSIAYAAKSGHPFTKTGVNGIIKDQKHRLYQELQSIGEKRIDAMIERLLTSGEIVKASAPKEKTAKWLDVPGGPFAIGMGEFESGKGEIRD